jgi:hypothetical protein
MGQQLAGKLREWADSKPGMRSAVELVIGDGWLANPDFVALCVSADSGVVSIDWTAVDGFVSDKLDVAALLQAQGIARDALLRSVCE